MLFRQAARRGFTPAMRSLAKSTIAMTPLSVICARPRDWYRAAAELGDAEAQFVLAQLCARGDGVPQHLGEAAKWFERAAEQGHAAAQVSIATC